MNTKVCTKCHINKSLDIINFYKDNKMSDSFSSWCRICNNINRSKRRVRKKPIPSEGHKICTCCKVEKLATLNFFLKQPRVRDGLHAICKLCAYQKKKKRLKIDPVFRACTNVSNRIRAFLREKHRYSSKLGCSQIELQNYLESLFQPGMSWNNYGKWQIDHKYPLSLAYKEGPESFEKAKHYTNLQPLWAIDNQKKGNKVI